MSNRESEKFGVEFVDPDKFIEFIEDSKDQDSGVPQAAAPMSSKPPQVEFDESQPSFDGIANESFEDEYDVEDDLDQDNELVYTDRITEEAGDYIIKKKEDTHRMAEANKAFAHFKV